MRTAGRSPGRWSRLILGVVITSALLLALWTQLGREKPDRESHAETGPSPHVAVPVVATGSEAAAPAADRREDAGGLVSWSVEGPAGEPLPSARVTIEGKTWPCDALGHGSAPVSLTDPVPAVVEASDHLAWRGLLSRGSRTRVVLSRGGSLEVDVVDELMEPVAEAEVWLSRRPTADPPQGIEASSRARTGADGRVVLAAPPGDYFLQARHELLVRSTRRMKQMGVGDGSYRVAIPAKSGRARVYMAMPHVCGVQAIGEPLLHHSFRGNDAGYHLPENPDGQAACKLIEDALARSHPGARFLVGVKDHESARKGRPYGAIEATAWIIGRVPFRGPVQMVPLREFTGPRELSSSILPASEDWGGVVVRIGDTGGLPKDGLKIVVRAAGSHQRNGAPSIRHMAVPSAEIVTLPAGVYDVSCEGHFESRDPGLGRRAVEVRSASLQEIVLESQFAWSYCRVSMDGIGSDTPLVGGMIELMHLDTGLGATILVSHFESPVSLWIPAGRVRLRGRAAHAAMPDHGWRSVEEEIEIGGGTLEVPQRIHRSMVLTRIR